MVSGGAQADGGKPQNQRAYAEDAADAEFVVEDSEDSGHNDGHIASHRHRHGDQGGAPAVGLCVIGLEDIDMIVHQSSRQVIGDDSTDIDRERIALEQLLASHRVKIPPPSKNGRDTRAPEL